jgi:hypothetical protein
MENAVANLNQLLSVRRRLIALRRFYLTRLWRMDIDATASFSLSARFDRTNPTGIHIGPESYVAFDAVVMSHDMTRRLHCDTWVGRRCFIGARSVILPGVRIGDESIVGVASVVTRDVPPNSIVAGNPARVLRSGVRLGPFGFILEEGEMDLSQSIVKISDNNRDC